MTVEEDEAGIDSESEFFGFDMWNAVFVNSQEEEIQMVKRIGKIRYQKIFNDYMKNSSASRSRADLVWTEGMVLTFIRLRPERLATGDLLVLA